MEKLFARFASATAKMAGSPVAFLICLVSVLIWAATGPAFHYSETWQLVINTGTTIVTFLMVFLIQNSQNRDGAAIQTKLDELIRASEAGDEFMGIETMTDKELEVLHAKCAKAARDSHRLLAQAEAERKARQSRTAKTARGPARARRRPATAQGAG
jgi:low affinity Fe/Cu permease